MCRCYKIIINDGKKQHISKKYCYIHDITKLYYLPNELWVQIFNYTGLMGLANLHLTCNYFHHYVSKFFNKRYYTVLNDINGHNITGNLDGDYKYLVNYKRPTYIIDNKILPSKVDAELLRNHVTAANLITAIYSYDDFVRIINTIYKNNYSEDSMFIRNSSLQEDVESYCESKIVTWLYNYMTNLLLTKPKSALTHFLPVNVKMHINWLRCPHIIVRTADMLRQKYPTLIIQLPNGHLSYTLDEFDKY